MSERKSLILPLLAAGSIKFPEEVSKIQVNCLPDVATPNVKNALKEVDLKVLFPSNQDDLVPLIGGSIVKLKLKEAEDIDTSAFKNVIPKYSVSALADFCENDLPAINKTSSDEEDRFVHVSNLVKLRNNINKSLLEMPNDAKSWYGDPNESSGVLQSGKGVPTLVLSRTKNGVFKTSEDLQKAIDKKKEKNMRIGKLGTPLGFFKFIPMQVLAKMLKAILAEEEKDYGAADYAGISGYTFKQLYGYLEKPEEKGQYKDLNDARIVSILLDIFPILKLKVSEILSESGASGEVGYYTVYKDSIYVKVPDLSGRDSNGYSINPYSLGEDGEDDIQFCFEFVRGVDEYTAKSFKALPPPAIEVDDNSSEFPDISTSPSTASASISISTEGIKDISKCTFYLSPLLLPSMSTRIRGFRTDSNGVELFTAPVLTKPYQIKDNTSKPVLDFPANIIEKIVKGFKEKTSKDDVQGHKITFMPTKDIPESKTEFVFSEDSSYKFEDCGLPLSESLSDYGVESLQDYLGEQNRPEILLGFRDGKGPEIINESKFYQEKVYSAKQILASNRPNIITEDTEQIPSVWIQLELDGSEDALTKTQKLKIPFKSGLTSGSAASDLSIYNNMGKMHFALYAVDELGQMVRAPGQNIKIDPNSPSVEESIPSGFANQKNGSVSVVNPETSISPSSLFAENSLTDWQIKGEGLVGASVVISADREGTQVLATLRDGSTVGAADHPVRIRPVAEDRISISTEAKFSDFLPNLVGTLWISVAHDGSGSKSDTVPLYVSQVGTEKDGLPFSDDLKVRFDDKLELSIKGFSDEVHSIPIIQDASSNANIIIKSEKKRFLRGAKLWGYIAILANEQNKAILEEDVGWLKDDGQKDEPILKTSIKTGRSTSEFYIPTELTWTYGGTEFSRVSSKKVNFKFPGPHVGVNMSRFTSLTAKGSKEHAAYILLANTEIHKGGDLSYLAADASGKSNYAIIPIGKVGGDPSSDEPAFTHVPEVLGSIVTLPSENGSPRIVSNIPRESLLSEGLEDKIEGISIKDIPTKGGQVLSIIASDELKRLSIVFRGLKTPKLQKTYLGYIGRKSLKKNLVSIKPAGNGIVVANYEDIDSISAEGWTDIRVQKNDKLFGCSYDSTLYNKVTVNIPSGDLKEGESEPLDPEGKFNVDSDYLIPKKENVDGKISFVTFKKAKSLCSIPFPGGNGNLSPLPLVKGSSYNPDDAVSGEAISENTYYNFSNPLKIYPSVDLLFGQIGKDKPYGMGLTDSKTDPKTGLILDELVKINTSGKVEPAMTPEEMKDALEQAAKEAESVISSIESDLEKLPKDSDEYKEKKEEFDKKKKAYEDTKKDAEDKVSEAESATLTKEEKEAKAREEAERLAEMQSQQAGEAGGALDGAAEAVGDAAAAAGEAADAAVQGVKDGLAAINGALSMLQTITDTLSSISDIANQFLDAAEDALAALGQRASDFVKVNIGHIYIDKDAVISSSALKKKEGGKEFKLITNYKFEQSSAIRFNVPEITAIKANNVTYTQSGENKFSQLPITSGLKIEIEAIGANKDTKFEISGKRLKTLLRANNPYDGIFTYFTATIPDMAVFSLFGTGDCISITASNSNNNRMRLGRQMGDEITVNLDKDWSASLFGGGRNKQGPSGDIAKHLKDNAFLKFCMVKLGKAAAGAKEALQSFCDFSLHLTAELSIQLRNLQVLMIPIKVIFCIIDVICALLNPWRLAFAVIRLFRCLYDLLLLLPPIAIPAMYLALLLHILELLLCVILKVLSYINAINEVSKAMAIAIEDKNYPAVAALEEALNDHILTLETDVSVLEPIITILALFLELLQLSFPFPCSKGGTGGLMEDNEDCIDPSMLAGLILGKAAPTGRIAPDILLPMAQAYTRLPVENLGSTGNSPPNGRDNTSDMNCDNGPICSEVKGDIVVRPEDETNSIVVKEGTPGMDIPTLINGATGEPKQIEDGGFFRGDEDGDGYMDNINYPILRTKWVEGTDGAFSQGSYYFGANDGYFDATFGLSFTKSIGGMSEGFGGPDPRLVKFLFNKSGETDDIAWWTKWLIFPMFFQKKTISELQTLDSPPMFLKSEGGSLKVGGAGFVSPIDGFSDFLDGEGEYLHPKPLTVTFELNEPSINPDTLDAEFVPVEVTKTFGNIPMIAVVDDQFNVYFVEKNGYVGGIQMDGNRIKSMNLKMINFPAAPKKKTGKEDQKVYASFSPKSANGVTVSGEAYVAKTSKNKNGEAVIYAQANASHFIGLVEDVLQAGVNAELSYDLHSTASKRYDRAMKSTWAGGTMNGQTLTYRGVDDDGDLAGTTTIHIRETLLNDGSYELQWSEELDAEVPFLDFGFAYDFGGGSSSEQQDIGNSIDSVKVFDFPRFYIVDMRQLADEIASACGAAGPAEFLLDAVAERAPIDLNVQDYMDCIEAFLKHFNSEELDEDGQPMGIIERKRYELENGILPTQISVEDAVSKYNVLRECTEDQIDKMCSYVVNPLNTGFKLLGDEDETPLDQFVDPSSINPADLAAANVIDEIEFDEDLDGFPSITGAMEYASGIGDMIIAEAGTKAIIEIAPRDSYDELMHVGLDLSNKIKIDIIKDETGGAEVVPPGSDDSEKVIKDGEIYTSAVTTKAAGKVVIKGSICGVTIQAVTDRGISVGSGSEETSEEDASSLEGCVDDALSDGSGAGTADETFAPGQLMKIDRTLTIMFVPSGSASLAKDSGPGALYGDGDRDNSGRSSKPNPQAFGTKLEN